ncbi:hypothetical protein V8E53_008002 [Lactarius tabidus]
MAFTGVGWILTLVNIKRILRNDMDPPDLGYVSTDGHHLECKNPILMRQPFHVIIFVFSYALPLPSKLLFTTENQIRIYGPQRSTTNPKFCRNRSHPLYGFWIARQAAIDRNAPVGGGRRDAYSLIFFNYEASTSSIENDFTSSPDELPTASLDFGVHGGTNFNKALDKTQELMTSHWGTERTPVVIFLSNCEDYVSDVSLAKGLFATGFSTTTDYAIVVRRSISFHAVSFGADTSSSSLRRMAQITLEVQYDRVCLAETFLGIAE